MCVPVNGGGSSYSMANRVTVVQNSREVSNMADKELNLSEEEQALLRQIRDEREQLSREIQVRVVMVLM